MKYKFCITGIKMKNFNKKKLYQALELLNSQLKAHSSKAFELIICGGSALIAVDLVSRTTNDVDIIALKNSTFGLIDPAPLSSELKKASLIVAKTLNLPEDWLNTGPADLFRMGLPEGFENRLITQKIGTHLTVHFSGRFDQIHFKLYASIDRGGYHIEDLLALKPIDEELVAAGRWSKTHDVSENFSMLLISFLKEIGFENAASKL